jgi:hypothetical protein
MKPPATFPSWVFALTPVLLGLTIAADVTAVQCPNKGTVVEGQVSNAKGKPYQAEEITTIVTYERDGTKRVSVTKSNLFRDSGGRIRVETFHAGQKTPPRTSHRTF